MKILKIVHISWIYFILNYFVIVGEYIFFVYSNWDFVTLFFISLPKHCFFLCSSSNNIYVFMCKYRYIFEHTHMSLK